LPDFLACSELTNVSEELAETDMVPTDLRARSGDRTGIRNRHRFEK
jgi:hypothetical protein